MTGKIRHVPMCAPTPTIVPVLNWALTAFSEKLNPNI